MARINLEDCELMAAVFAQHHCDSLRAGQLYTPGATAVISLRLVPSHTFVGMKGPVPRLGPFNRALLGNLSRAPKHYRFHKPTRLW